MGVLTGGTLFAFTVSTTLGLGGGVLMLPPMLFVYDTPTAIAMIAPLMLVNAIGKILAFRKHLDWRLALKLGVLGWPLAFVAGLSVDQLDPRILKGGIVVLIAVMLSVEHGLGKRTRISDNALLPWGALTGVLAGMTGVSGPTLALALKGRGVQGATFVAVVATVVLGLQVLRIPAYVARGVLPPEQLKVLWGLSGVAIAAIALGRAIQERLSVARWRVGLDGLLVLVGLWLLLDVVGVVGV